ncbi:MAG: hypothetical protein HY810_07065 [Candidatus Omnitrophica bacterium]|nr:hypothetical protein [Candidatus Omnitrophota bacterium]
MLSKLKYISLVFIAGLVFNNCIVYAQETNFRFPANVATGSWQVSEIEGKEVITTAESDAFEQINIMVPKEGNYQLYVSLYHRWIEFAPFLYARIVDSKGKVHHSYVFSEPRWYLEKGQGRWEYRCFSAEPYWHLPKGRLKIKFWVKAKRSSWKQDDVPMPADISIGDFVLVPVNEQTNEQLNLTLP